MQFIEKFKGQLRALLNFNSSMPVCCPMPWRMDSFFMVQIPFLAHLMHCPLWTALCKITDAPYIPRKFQHCYIVQYARLYNVQHHKGDPLYFFFILQSLSLFLSASFINLLLNWIYFGSCIRESGLSHSWLFKQQPSLPQSASSLPDTLTLLASSSCPQSSSEPRQKSCLKAVLSLFHLFIQCSSCHDPVTLPEMCGHGLKTQQDFPQCSFWLWQWGKKSSPRWSHGMGFKKICKTCSNKL